MLSVDVVHECNECMLKVRYLGLLENVRVRRAGFAFRMPFNRFLRRLVHRIVLLASDDV